MYKEVTQLERPRGAAMIRTLTTVGIAVGELVNKYNEGKGHEKRPRKCANQWDIRRGFWVWFLVSTYSR